MDICISIYIKLIRYWATDIQHTDETTGFRMMKEDLKKVIRGNFSKFLLKEKKWVSHVLCSGKQRCGQRKYFYDFFSSWNKKKIEYEVKILNLFNLSATIYFGLGIVIFIHLCSHLFLQNRYENRS